jgi:cytidine deaminase
MLTIAGSGDAKKVKIKYTGKNTTSSTQNAGTDVLELINQTKETTQATKSSKNLTSIKHDLKSSQSELKVIKHLPEKMIKPTKDSSKSINDTLKSQRNSKPTPHMQVITYEDLDSTEQALLDQASQAMDTSYSPYSHFEVGAAILTDDQQIINGSNVENAAYGSTICAERSAIMRANAMQKAKNLRAVAIIGRPHKHKTDDIVSPCGACRQVIYELSGKHNTKIIMSNTDKSKIMVSTIKELLPLAFGPNNLD